ncbi:hypothetical protein EDB80DRAFT_133371 [Ilyonectria destructans]|nr:hypothetical protein EDB80DRAFT_133371 [Ilyonectria destructans]
MQARSHAVSHQKHTRARALATPQPRYGTWETKDYLVLPRQGINCLCAFIPTAMLMGGMHVIACRHGRNPKVQVPKSDGLAHLIDFPSSHMASWGCARGETLFFPSPVTRSCTASCTTSCCTTSCCTTQNNTSQRLQPVPRHLSISNVFRSRAQVERLQFPPRSRPSPKTRRVPCSPSRHWLYRFSTSRRPRISVAGHYTRSAGLSFGSLPWRPQQPNAHASGVVPVPCSFLHVSHLSSGYAVQCTLITGASCCPHAPPLVITTPFSLQTLCPVLRSVGILDSLPL